MANNAAGEWGIPDWKNKNAYPLNDGALTTNAWRWEFLRRDRDYRTAWKNRKDGSLPNWEYGLTTWLDPSDTSEPNFTRPCHEIRFDKKGAWEQRFHYMALADAQKLGGLFFSIDIYAPIEPQIEIIRDAYNKSIKSKVHPDDRALKAPRKNNSASKSKSRSRGLMLRLLDADNADVSIPDFLDHVGFEGIAVSETSMRRTLSFAKDFWKRL